jgi:hypothetical protein
MIGGGKMGEEVIGDPGKFAGASEHSQQVALFAAVAQYAFSFRKEGEDLQLGSLFPNNLLEWWEKNGKSPIVDAQVMFDAGQRLVDIAEALEWFHAIPNGGTRGSDKRSAMIAGANMKAEGAKPGVSDTCLPYAAHGYHGFYIEMKAPGKLKGESDDQKRYGAYLAKRGYLYAVFDSWHAALKALMWYLGFEHSKEWVLP